MQVDLADGARCPGIEEHQVRILARFDGSLAFQPEQPRRRRRQKVDHTFEAHFAPRRTHTVNDREQGLDPRRAVADLRKGWRREAFLDR